MTDFDRKSLLRLKKAELVGLVLEGVAERAGLVDQVADLKAENSESASVEKQLRRALPAMTEMSSWLSAKATVALNLAAQLDTMAAGYHEHPPAPAPVAKQLLAVLADLETALSDDDEDSLFAALSAPVRDQANT